MKTIKNKGITLIALVVTIIVLVILAGVSISMLTGENGILKRAQEAKEKTEIATEDEQRKMAMFEATMNTELTYFQDVPIPAGFAPTRIAGESTVDEGLVITDSEGNEFVWVPVINKSDFKRTEGYSAEELQMSYFSKCTEVDEKGGSSQVLESETTKAEAKEMYESVKKYGGFFIGRYEAGNVGGTLKSDDEGNTYYWEGNSRVVVKKGATVYNNIKWNELGESDITSDKGGAIEEARKFKEGKAWENSATSTLIYGVQWDATMQFFDKKYKDKNCLEDSYVRNSTGKGWYKDNYQTGNPEHKTGIELLNNANKVKNIYDMGGNVWEWTMENCNDNDGMHRVFRGGAYYNTASKSVASSRGNYNSNFDYFNVGFRVALYVN